MKLSQLIDLEVQLLRDEQAAGEGRAGEVARRDRAIGTTIAERVGLETSAAARDLASSQTLRHRVCQEWLSLLPADTRTTLPGVPLERAYGLVGWILLALSFFAGLGTAGAALHGTDEQPINVLVFIVIFFVLQIALLVLFPVFMLVRHLRGGEVLPWLSRMIDRLSRVPLLARMTGQSLRELPTTLQQLQMRKIVYGGVQRWQLFSLVQRMATGFNFAALLTSLYMVTFHDLANSCWSTTLAVEPGDLHRWLSWIALPWSWIDGIGAPGLDAIQYSRWVTSGDSGYVTPPDGIDGPSLRRTWWPFLLAGLITWGLLPRALAYGFGAFLTARKSRLVPLNHMTVQHLFERLFPPDVAWTGPSPETVRGDAPVAKETRPPRPLNTDPTAACQVVCWGTLFDDRDTVGEHVRGRFHREVEQTLGAGLADVEEDGRTLTALTRARAKRVVVVMPEGQQPTKDVTRFLSGLRERLGAECELVVGLLARTEAGFGDVDPDEMEAWRRRLLAEGDPYLTLQTMGHET